MNKIVVGTLLILGIGLAGSLYFNHQGVAYYLGLATFLLLLVWIFYVQK